MTKAQLVVNALRTPKADCNNCDCERVGYERMKGLAGMEHLMLVCTVCEATMLCLCEKCESNGVRNLIRYD